jgi:hypothetical protein
MTQTRLGSFIEAVINIIIGFAINWGMNMLVLPWFGFDITGGQAFAIGLIFTVVSVARMYAIRRWFNNMLRNAAERIAREVNHA